MILLLKLVVTMESCSIFLNKYKVLGVDPATNVILRTLKKDIPAVPLFFSSSLAKKLIMNGEKQNNLW